MAGLATPQAGLQLPANAHCRGLGRFVGCELFRVEPT